MAEGEEFELEALSAASEPRAEIPSQARDLIGMAEGEGFAPPVPVKVQRFSRPPVSTAHASLRAAFISLPALRNWLRTVGGQDLGFRDAISGASRSTLLQRAP